MSTEPDVLDDAALLAFDPAEYPCRLMVTPIGAPGDAIVSVVWIPTPWAGYF